MMKLDILAIGAHPDDVELGCAGTLLSHIARGKKAGILDLTRGELGTRGTAATRQQEAAAAAAILGVSVRDNAGFGDGFFPNDKAHQLELICYIRQYQPDIILTNAITDRHPDHGRSAALTEDAVFLSGLTKVETRLNGQLQAPFRPRAVYHYIQALDITPDIAVDITPYYDTKIEAVMAYKTQFYDPNSTEPETFISKPEFLELIKGRASHFGAPIGVRFAEAYTSKRLIGVRDLEELL